MGNERVYECLNYNSIAYLQMKAFLSAGENTAENRKDDRKIVEKYIYQYQEFGKLCRTARI